MSAQVVQVSPGESAALCARLFSRYNLGALPVCGADGGVVGIVTDRDIVVRCVAAGRDPAETAVGEIMTRGPAGVGPEEDADTAAGRMARAQVRRLPVVEDGRVVGMLSLGDLARCRACSMEAGTALGRISDVLRPAAPGREAHGKPGTP